MASAASDGSAEVVDNRRRDGRVRRGGNVQIQSIHAGNDDDRVIEIIGNEPSPNQPSGTTACWTIVENRDLSEMRRILTAGGTLICNSGTGATGFAFWIRLLKPLIVSPFVSQTLCRYISTTKQADLRQMIQMLVEQNVRPVIASQHRIDEVAGLLNLLEQGHTAGKPVVVLSKPSPN